LEYSTDEQRNVICESVAQDLVNISLNMHGTRAVQKMIDFLSTRRQASLISFLLNLPHLRGAIQADLRYNAQIHSIIVALSLHVVVLIKDLNGNHVIQKCLNKLAPEDNQVGQYFILYYMIFTQMPFFGSSFTTLWQPTVPKWRLMATDLVFCGGASTMRRTSPTRP
jgi:hypothetical protein